MIAQTHKGFTLIELMVVIAILGLLASIILASVGISRTKGKAAAVKTALTSFRNQLELNANGGGYGATTNYSIGTGNNGACSFLAFATVNVSAIKTGLTNNLAASTDYVCSTNVSDLVIPATRWAVAAILPDGSGMICYDSNGASKSWPAITAVGSITTSQINNGVCQ